MLASKAIVDKYFQDNWVLTPIQYDGVDFTTPADNKWVSVQLIPLDRQITGFDGTDSGTKTDLGIIRIRTYDVSVTLSMLLANEVLQFLECITISDLRVGVGVADGNGALALGNDVFEVTVDFDTRKYQ